MKDFLPLMLNLGAKEVIIFGGGEVGERKAALFCDHAKVTVISREFTARLNQLSDNGKIVLIRVKDINEKEASKFLKNAFIVIPATNDSGLNEMIEKLAARNGKLVNRVDARGDIIVPSVIERGDIVIGISTGGKSPALSRYIRERIENIITPEFAQMAKLQTELREILKSNIKDQKKRKEILWNVINDNEVWAAFKESYEKAYKIASKHIGKEK